ncbi:MAG: hypothetical protein CBB97_24770 [Candidatus Endolissoclinum sp. TMED37]|nr:MAG: hypothetical protein CBB97_24770 [Candidatus Endolissoclinum sp. TMED37]
MDPSPNIGLKYFFNKSPNITVKNDDSNLKKQIQIKLLKIKLKKIQKKIITLQNSMKPITIVTNETIGITAESVACLIFNIHCDLEENRLSMKFSDKLLNSGVIEDICSKNNLILTEHIGKENKKTDFYGLVEGKKVSVSLKTLKKNDGKICPQGGQPTYVSFHKYHPECPVPADGTGRFFANTMRWKWIKDNIGFFLNRMQERLFCCDYLMLIYNCDKSPKCEMLKNKNIDFTKLKIHIKNPVYMEKPDKTKKGRVCEFSTTIYVDSGGYAGNPIGEFQFHTKDMCPNTGKMRGREVIKFRFYNTFYN